MNSNILTCRELINKKVVGIIISVFPPLYEENIENADISINLELDNGKSYTLTTSENQWSCSIISERLVSKYNFSDFETRMKFWMHDEQAEFLPLEYETYNVASSDILGSLLNSQIIKAEFLNINNSQEFNPHGIKLYFETGEFLISTCGHDGNTIQTSKFLEGRDLINRFKSIGKTELIKC